MHILAFSSRTKVNGRSVCGRVARTEDFTEIIHFSSFNTQCTAKLENGQKLGYWLEKMEEGYSLPFLGYIF